jgi:hypothetical protein
MEIGLGLDGDQLGLLDEQLIASAVLGRQQPLRLGGLEQEPVRGARGQGAQDHPRRQVRGRRRP